MIHDSLFGQTSDKIPNYQHYFCVVTSAGDTVDCINFKCLIKVTVTVSVDEA